MHIGRIKIGNSFLVLLALYLLGYTHFLGGPYGLARFFFIGFLICVALLVVFLWGMARFTKNIFKKQINNFDNKMNENNETIKVDAKIID